MRPSNAETDPTWQALYDVASSQEGLFTTRVKRSPLATHLLCWPTIKKPAVLRVYGVESTASFISRQGSMRNSSPRGFAPAWRQRRLRVPEGIVLHFAEVPSNERSWVDAVPVTSTSRRSTIALSRDSPQTCFVRRRSKH